MSTYGEGLYLPLLNISGCLLAPIHHYYAGIKSQAGPLHAIMQTNTPGQLADQHVRSTIDIG